MSQDYDKLIKCYYIEQTYVLYNRDPDARVWWSWDRNDTWQQIQDFVTFQKDSFGYETEIKHFVSSREIYSSLVSLYDHFKYKNMTSQESSIRELPKFTEVTVYSNLYDSESDWYVDPYDNEDALKNLHERGMGYIEEIELTSIVALVVR